MVGARGIQRIVDEQMRHARIGSTHFIAMIGNQIDSHATLWKAVVTGLFFGPVNPPFNDSARSSGGLPREFHAGVDC